MGHAKIDEHDERGGSGERDDEHADEVDDEPDADCGRISGQSSAPWVASPVTSFRSGDQLSHLQADGDGDRTSCDNPSPRRASPA